MRRFCSSHRAMASENSFICQQHNNLLPRPSGRLISESAPGHVHKTMLNVAMIYVTFAAVESRKKSVTRPFGCTISPALTIRGRATLRSSSTGATTGTEREGKVLFIFKLLCFMGEKKSSPPLPRRLLSF